MHVRIYTHSSIRSIRPAAGVARYILETEIGGKEATLSGKVVFKNNPTEKWEHEKASNYLAQIICLTSAMQRLTSKCDSLEIYTDSELIEYRFEEIDELSRKDFMDTRERKIAGADYWKRINEILCRFNLKPIIHVKEHHSFRKWFEEQEKING